MDDIIAVTADSLRADHCGYQSETDLTPTLDALAADSLTFTNAIAPGPRTLSSVPVTHTGVPFAETDHDVGDYAARVARIRDHVQRFETVSERLRAEGYTTVAFTANPWTSADNEFDVGFDEFREVGRTGGYLPSLFSGTPVETPARLFDQWIHKDAWFSQWRTFYEEFADTVQSIEGPVFAWVFLLDTHNPYIVPKADREASSLLDMYSALFEANDALNQTGGQTMYRRSLDDSTIDKLTAAYRDSVRSVDAFVDRLVGTFDDATILFHADHGEAFGEHGTFGHEPVLYEENIHVPLFVHNAGTTRTVDSVVSTTVVPEILSTVARGETVDPASLTAEYAVARNESDTALAVRGDRWKYIRDESGERLFDLATDPEETTDVSDREPDVLDEFRAKREAYLASLPDADAETGAVESEDMRAHLQSLGYLQE